MPALAHFALTLSAALGASLAAFLAATRLLRHVELCRRISRWIGPTPRVCDRIFVLSFALYLLVFGALATLRYLSFNSGPDLGLYDQLVWNSLHGRLFQNTLLADAPFYLGKSFSPILLAFVPIYGVWANPVALVLTQTIALGATAFPVYWFARERIGHPLALVIAWAFFLSPAVQSINMVDVHGIAFAAPALAFATYFLFHHRYKPFLVCLGIALLIREEIALIVIVFGVYVFLVERRRVFGAALFLFGCVATVALLNYIIPFFHGSDYAPGFYYFGSGVTAEAQTRYTYLGHGIPEILGTIITQPGVISQHILTPAKIEFVLHLVVPLGLLPLIGIEACFLALPTLGYSLLSEFGFQYSITSFYTAPMLPFLFFGTALGARRIIDWKRRNDRDEDRAAAIQSARKFAIGSGLMVSALFSYYFVGRGPFAQNFEPQFLVLNQHTEAAEQIARMIPAEATVAAQTEYLAHLSSRQAIYDFPGFPDYRGVEYLVADPGREWYGLHKTDWDQLLTNGFFEVVARNEGILLAKRREIAQPLGVRFGDALKLDGVTVTPFGTIRGGTALRPIVYWHADRNIVQRYWERVRLEDAQGHVWAEQDREPQDGKIPTTQWQVDRLIVDQFNLLLPPTMPSGDYRITIALHENGSEDLLAAVDLQGKSIGDEIPMSSLTIQKDKSSVAASDLQIEQPLFVDMQEMRFLGYVPPPKNIRAGEALHLGLYWRARTKPNGDYLVVVQLRDQAGRVVFEQATGPANGSYPTTTWDAGEVLLDWHDLSLPADLVPGDYQIVVSLGDFSHGLTLGEIPLGTISTTR